MTGETSPSFNPEAEYSALYDELGLFLSQEPMETVMRGRGGTAVLRAGTAQDPAGTDWDVKISQVDMENDSHRQMHRQMRISTPDVQHIFTFRPGAPDRKLMALEGVGGILALMRFLLPRTKFTEEAAQEFAASFGLDFYR